MYELAKQWQNYPPVNNAYRENWYTQIIQIWQAIRERKFALGQFTWPANSASGEFFWGSGIVGSIADNGNGTFTLTDGTTPPNDWTTTGATGWTGKVFAGGSAPGTTYRPISFDCIISFDDLDPRKQIRAHITDNTSTTLTIRDYSDYVIAKLIGTIEAAGKKFYVVGENALWWGDKEPTLSRWPDYPNDFEDEFGTIASSASGYAILNAFDTGKVFADDHFKGRDLVAFGDDEKLHRAVISGSTTDVATQKPKVLFNASGWLATGAFSITSTGGIVYPGRTNRSTPILDYSGRLTEYFVHEPTDPLTPTTRPIVATDVISFSDGDDELSCPSALLTPELLLHDAFTEADGGLDVWSSVTNVCSAANKSYTPWFFKSLVNIQTTIESLCADFIPPIGYPTAGRNPKQHFTLVLLFYHAGINAGVSTVLDKVSGNYHAAVDPIYNGHSVYYTILNQEKYKNNAGTERDSGTATVVDGQIDLGTALYDDADEAAVDTHYSDVGSQVFWSTGWTRHYPKMFRNMYRRVGFIPFVDTSEGGAGVIYPPSIIDFGASGCDGVGQWIIREASTNLMKFDARGRVETGEAFAVGDVATYMGESFQYPLDPALPSDGDDGTLKFYDRFSETKHPSGVFGTTQATIEAQTSGAITSHNSYSLTDSTKNWLSNWYGGGELRTESGTITAVGSTFIEDSTKASGASNCWWQLTRFNGFSFPYQGFILEIDHESKTFKTPITNVDPDIVRVSFSNLGIGFSVGEAYRIIEPDTMLNRYAGKIVSITRGDGSKLELTIQASDKTTLYFSVPVELKSGWSYQIEEFYPGGTYQWNGTKWIKPSGLDARGNVQFRPTPEENAPDQIKAYGRIHKLDYFSASVFDEIYRTINVLIWTEANASWTNRHDEYNTKHAGSLGEELKTYPGVPPGGYADRATMLAAVRSLVEDRWDDIPAPPPPTNTPNFAIWDKEGSPIPKKTAWQANSEDYDASGALLTGATQPFYMFAEYAWVHVAGIATILTPRVEFYAYSTIDQADTPQGITWTWYPVDKVNDGTLGVFNAYGLPLMYRQFSPIGEATADGTEVGKWIISTAFGDIAKPSTPGDLAPTIGPENSSSSGTITAEGYYVVETIAIIKWDRAMRFV